MKYCKVCKTAAKDTETLCPEGHPLSVFGAAPQAALPPRPAGGPATHPGSSPPGPRPAGAMFTLLGQVQELEEARAKHVKRGRAFGLMSLLAALAIATVLYQVYARTVLAYAILSNVRVEQDPDISWMVHVAYDVDTPGKVAFDRKSGPRRIEKLDLIDARGPQGFTWTWPSDPKTGIDFHVRYRGGWLLQSFDRHFDAAAPPAGF